MKICVLGASGFIGNLIYTSLQGNLVHDTIIGTSYSRLNTQLLNLNLLDSHELTQFVSLHQDIDVYIYAAGDKNILHCQQEPLEAFNINSFAVAKLVTLLEKENNRARLVYISSDYVFDGKDGNYATSDVCAPQTIYGMSKRMAELDVLSHSKNLVIRTAAVTGRNSSFVTWLQTATDKKPAELFTNAIFSPISTSWFGQAICKVVKMLPHQLPPIIHLVGNRQLTRADFGQIILEILGRPITIKPVQTTPDNIFFPPNLSLSPTAEFCPKNSNEWEDYLIDSLLSNT